MLSTYKYKSDLFTSFLYELVIYSITFNEHFENFGSDFITLIFYLCKRYILICYENYESDIVIARSTVCTFLPFYSEYNYVNNLNSLHMSEYFCMLDRGVSFCQYDIRLFRDLDSINISESDRIIVENHIFQNLFNNFVTNLLFSINVPLYLFEHSVHDLYFFSSFLMDDSFFSFFIFYEYYKENEAFYVNIRTHFSFLFLVFHFYIVMWLFNNNKSTTFFLSDIDLELQSYNKYLIQDETALRYFRLNLYPDKLSEYFYEILDWNWNDLDTECWVLQYFFHINKVLSSDFSIFFYLYHYLDYRSNRICSNAEFSFVLSDVRDHFSDLERMFINSKDPFHPPVRNSFFFSFQHSPFLNTVTCCNSYFTAMDFFSLFIYMNKKLRKKKYWKSIYIDLYSLCYLLNNKEIDKKKKLPFSSFFFSNLNIINSFYYIICLSFYMNHYQN